MDLYKLYRASPEGCFLYIRDKIEELDGKLNNLSRYVNDIVKLSDALITDAAQRSSQIQAPTKWMYDVRLPNIYFSDVFDCERVSSGFKRWVGRSGSIGTKLLLPRNCQYDFTFFAQDFISPELRDSLTLSINGETYPWLDKTGSTFHTVVLESPEATHLEFVLAVDSASLPESKDVSFSFSQILIERRG